MKLYKRCLSLLLLSVCLFGVFSLDVSAEENVSYIMKGAINNGTNYLSLNGKSGVNYTWQSPIYTSNMNSSFTISFRPTIQKEDGTPILKKGQSFSFELTGIKPYLYFADTGTTYLWKTPDYLNAEIVYIDGTKKTLGTSNCDYYFSNDTEDSAFVLNARGKAEKDVQFVRVYIHYIPYNQISTGLGNRQYIMYVELRPFDFKIDIQSEEAGLLDGILGWVQNIFNKIEDTFEAITELPSKIWQFISDGLKALFIPDDDFIVGFKDKFDELLADRLGAVYQVGDVLIESWEKIEEADEKDTVTMPKVSINLPENNKFEFGGFDVKIVPDGFSVLVNAVKLILGIVCTCLFFNGLLKRYDEVMGVEQ